MHRYGIEDEAWFEAVRVALANLGYALRLLPHSIVLEKEERNPRIFGSARDLLEFAQRQGATIGPQVFAAADLYGDGKPGTLAGRRTDSQFETPVSVIFRDAAPHDPSDPGGSQDAEIGRLKQTLAEAEQQRDMWRMTAISAQDRLAAQGASGLLDLAADKRFEQMKRLLARELHPDLAASDDERRLREDLFKRVWAKIEKLR